MQIIWNVEPAIIKTVFFELRYYSILFAAGLITAYFIFLRLNRGFFSQHQTDVLTFLILIGTIAGARLGHCLFYDFSYYSKHIPEIFLPFSFDKNAKFILTGYQGLSSHGGAAGILIAILIFCKKYKQNLLAVLDKICVVVPAAGGFIRLGNLMNSEIIGKPSNAYFGFIFKRIDDIPRHPAQLYESVCYFIVFIALLTVYKKTKISEVNGKIFGLFLMLVFSCRFLIEFLKENQSSFENGMILNMGQILSLPFLIFGLVLFFYKRKRI